MRKIMLLLIILNLGSVINATSAEIFEDDFSGTKIDWLKWIIAPQEFVVSQVDELIVNGKRASYGDPLWGHNATIYARPLFFGNSIFQVDMKKESFTGTGFAIWFALVNDGNYISIMKIIDTPLSLNTKARIVIGPPYTVLYDDPNHVDSEYDNYRIETEGTTVKFYLNDNHIFSTTVDWINGMKQVALLATSRAFNDTVSGKFDNFLTISDENVCPLKDKDNDGYSIEDGDCDDNDPLTFPLATEVCDEIDNDCNGIIDDVFDFDNDGFSECSGDCNDHDLFINPAAIELPGNDIDENCDGSLGLCSPDYPWKNHGEYVRCVAHEVEELIKAGIIFQDHGDKLVSTAAQSQIGK